MHTLASFELTAGKPSPYYTECLIVTDSGVMYDITFCPNAARPVIGAVWSGIILLNSPQRLA